MSTPACAYLVSRYPSVTHTFVTGEVRALRSTGVRVETASVRKVPDSETLSRLDRRELERTKALLPISGAALAQIHARAFRRAPRAYLATLVDAVRMAHAGGRARLWQLFYFGEALILWAWMGEQDVRHVHVHHANVSADVALLACRYGNRTGSSARWTWSLSLHGPTELFDVAGHKLARKVDDASAVVCISDFAASQVAAVAEGDASEKLHTVRCGIDLEAFGPGRGDRTGGSVEFLCVGALSRRKGHAVLLEAFAQVLRGEPEAALTIVGDGPERAGLEERARGLGIDRSVRFIGAVEHDQLASLYSEADVFCLPSFAEGIPIVLMEAMAMELPVVASNIMGIPELVDHGVSGLLVAPARADLLAAALIQLLDDPDLRVAMGQEGRRRVVAYHDGSASAVELRRILDPLMTQS